MQAIRWAAGWLLVLVAASTSLVDGVQPKDDDGFVPMFNGRELTGWVNVNGAPGTFFVKDNQIITTGRPTGYLRTEKQYENFIAEFDWMHIPNKAGDVGNSGFFVWCDPIPAVGSGYTRGIEVQVLVNLEWKDKKSGESTATSHGDLFSIWGARCTPDRPHPLGWERCIPSENRAKGEGEWNHYRVEANDGVIKLAVNGKIVSGVSKCSPRKGYLALESEGSECRFKNLKIKEFPSTKPRPEEICDIAQGHKAMYDGLGTVGWRADPVSVAPHWIPRDTVLHYDGQGEAKDNSLTFAKEYGDAEFIVDFRFPAGKTPKEPLCRFVLRGDKGGFVDVAVTPADLGQTKGPVVTTRVIRPQADAGDSSVASFKELKPAGQWNRLKATLQGKTLTVTINGKEVARAFPRIERVNSGTFAMESVGPMDFANLFVRELK